MALGGSILNKIQLGGTPSSDSAETGRLGKMGFRADFPTEHREGLESTFSGANRQWATDAWNRQFRPSEGAPPGIDMIQLKTSHGAAAPHKTLVVNGRTCQADASGNLRIVDAQYWDRLAQATQERRDYCKRVASWVLVSDEVAKQILSPPGFAACCKSLAEAAALFPNTIGTTDQTKYAEWARSQAYAIWTDLPGDCATEDCRPSMTNGLAPTSLEYQRKVSKLLQVIERCPLAVVDGQPSIGYDGSSAAVGVGSTTRTENTVKSIQAGVK